jgi:murein DD-endopeptidase MepM/ murein hydrolase activator NlpD
MNYLSPPIKDFKWRGSISQLFGVNAETYKQFLNDQGKPIAGHNGLDIVFRNDPKMGYGQDVFAAADGVVSQKTYDNETHTRGNGIYLLHDVMPDGRRMETVYWHVIDFQVEIGQRVRRGDVIAKVGNNGFVFPKPSPSCPYCGSHLHFACRFYQTSAQGLKLIRTDYGSGYSDPTPYMYNSGEKLPLYFSRNLTLGLSGDDVSWLQTVLKIEGFAKDYEPIGYFGRKTLRDAIAFQKKYSIYPTFGYVGAKTRAFLNEKYA